MNQFSDDNPFASPQKQPPPYIPPPLNGDPKKIEEARESVAFLKASNAPNSQIYDLLIQRGIDHQTAVQLIESTMAQIPKSQQKNRQSGINNMIFGVLLVVLGIGISVASYDSVSESGGQYFVLFGPVIAGIWLFFKGVSQL
jgi:hypothetical protein